MTTPNHPQRRLSAFCLPIVMVGVAGGCTEPGSPADVDIVVTATGGAEEGGNASTDDDGGGDGLDESGGGPTEASECLFQSAPGYFGYKFRCRGDFVVKIEVNDLDPEFLDVGFGGDDDPDSYEEPLVMACCPPYSGPVCAEPHQQACYVDMIEQGCKSLVPRLEEYAKEHPLIKEPVLKTAEWIAKASSQAECINAFIFDTGVGTTPPTCDEHSNSVFDYADALDGATWSFNPDTTTLIDSVVLTLDHPFIDDWDAPGDPPQFTTCDSSSDNDDLSFLEIDPTIGDVKVKMAGGSVSLLGPVIDGEKISGNATLASSGSRCSSPYCSHAAWTLGQSSGGELHAMSLYSSGPADVGTSSEEMTVDSFQFHLFSPAKGTGSGTTLTIEPGEALFVMSGTAIGESRWVPAWNSTAIEIRPVRNYWSISTFTIDYEDSTGDVWDMDVAPSTWR